MFVEQSQRRIPVQYAKRVVGRRTLGGSSTYIPLKINMAGVIPVIFASSLLTLPTVIAQFAGDDPAPWVEWMQNNIAATSSPCTSRLYILLIVFFAYFYTAITFNPDQVADDMKKYGGFIPGIRPGKPTADFLVVRAVSHHGRWLDLPRARRAGPDARLRARWACPRTSRSAARRS